MKSGLVIFVTLLRRSTANGVDYDRKVSQFNVCLFEKSKAGVCCLVILNHHRQITMASLILMSRGPSPWIELLQRCADVNGNNRFKT